MADGIPTPIDPVQLGTVDVELYLVPAGKVGILKHMLLNAGTGSNAQIRLYRRLASSGGDFDIRSSSTNSLLLLADTESWDLDMMLGPGESIRGSSDLGTGVYVHLSAIQAVTAGETEYPLVITPVNLGSGVDTQVHLVAAGFVDIIKEILVNSGTYASAQLGINRRAGGVDYPMRTKSTTYPIGNGSVELHHYDLMLDENESIRMNASTTGVDIHISAIRVTKS